MSDRRTNLGVHSSPKAYPLRIPDWFFGGLLGGRSSNLKSLGGGGLGLVAFAVEFLVELLVEFLVELLVAFVVELLVVVVAAGVVVVVVVS